MMCAVDCFMRGSSAFGVSAISPSSPRCNDATTAGGNAPRPPRVSSTSSASANVLGSGIVGPDPITDKSSPTTSEITSVMTGPAVAAASLPPLIADRCLRTALSSSIVAPPFRSCRTVSLLILERDALGGERHQRRGAAGEQHDEQIAPRRSGRNRQRAPGRLHAARVGNGMPRVIPFDARGQRVRTHRSDTQSSCAAACRSPRQRRSASARTLFPRQCASICGRGVQLGGKGGVAQRVAHEASSVGSLYRGVENLTQLVTKMLNGKGQ